MTDEYDIKNVMPGGNTKRNKILDRLSEMNDESYVAQTGYSASSFLPSSMLKEPKQKKKHDEDEIDFNSKYDPDAWFNELMGTQNTRINKKKIRNNLFDSAGITGKKKKKKGKKDKKDEFIDFKREFEPEAALYKNLLVEQSRFTDTLQKEYDSIKSTKSSSRGITKQMTDLVENINGARQLAMQLIDKQVAIKKQAAELNMKQKKELGSNLGDGENMADFASSYLKQMLSDRQTLFNGGEGEAVVSDYTDDEMFDELALNLSDEENTRPDEVEKYLKYENKNVTLYIVIRDNDVENYYFLARDELGNDIYDYPMPDHTKISVNRSTGIATDIYGKKYRIIWE